MQQALLRRSRALAATAAAAIPLGLVAFVAPAAQAANPAGSVFELFLEPGDGTGDPANAITTGGFWGHETAARNQGTAIQGDQVSDGGAGLLAAFGGDVSNTAIVFAPSSADGSSERPAVTAGQNIGQAYQWFTEFSFPNSFTGTPGSPASDSVVTVSTLAEYQAWITDGKPDQLISGVDLLSRDATKPGAPVSTAPKGKSILNRWAAGQNISLVVVKTTGATDPSTGLPIVARGADGKAISAWLKFTTGLDPKVGPSAAGNNTIATSGAYTLAVDPVNTTTTLAAAPASPQLEGTAVTFTATVAQASGAAKPTGSVVFKDGATTLATVPVDATGTAAYATSSLAVGGHSITAEYTPTGAFVASSSSALAYTINATPATDTTTAVSAVSASGFAFDPVTLTATVAPAAGTVTPAGTVQFKNGSTNIGSPVTLDATGVATVDSSAIGVGTANITAIFTPADPAKFNGSSSSPISLALTAKPVGDTETSTVVAEIEAGTIAISTPYTPAAPLDLGALALNSNASQYVGSAIFDAITVTDTRAGALPWTLTALSSNLESGSNLINAQNVGLTDLVEVSKTGLGTVTTTNNPAAEALAPGDGGTLGLGGTPKTVLTVVNGPGTVVYKGTLTVKAPTSTQAGTYTGTVTFTVS